MKRIELIDGLRGYAIICIALLHFINHFIAVYPTDNLFSPQLNKGVWDFLYFAFEGKSYSIFALLLGVTYGIQTQSRALKGETFRMRFLWRMALLGGFGFLNALIFPGGDPLFSFAINSIILLLAGSFTSRGVLYLSLFLLLQPYEIFLIIRSLMDPAYAYPKNLCYPMYEALKPFVDKGDFLAMAKANLTIGMQAALYWTVDVGRLCQTPGLFCLGYWLYITNFFSPERKHTLKKLPLLVLLATSIYFSRDLIQTALADKNYYGPLNNLLTMWYNLAGTSVLLCLVLFLLQKFEGKRLESLYAYGKMSLTNYIGQNAIGSFLLLAWGLNLDKHLDVTSSLILGISVIFLQLIFSKWWIDKYKMGPLEKIWHRLTWIKLRS